MHWHLFAASLIFASFAGNDEKLGSLPGSANDSDGNLTWSSDASRHASGDWTIEHSVKNRAASGNLRVLWNPKVYDGWVPSGQKRGSSSIAGGEKPEVEKGNIQYDRKGDKEAPSYRQAKAPQAPSKAETKVSITLEVGTKLQDLDVQATAQVMDRVGAGFPIVYTLSLTQRTLAPVLRVEWEAARSAPLNQAVMERHDANRMILSEEDGKARYEITSREMPVLRAGAIVFYDIGGKRLGAAYAPAYAPPAD
jgi:hypothetical protein